MVNNENEMHLLLDTHAHESFNHLINHNNGLEKGKKKDKISSHQIS